MRNMAWAAAIGIAAASLLSPLEARADVIFSAAETTVAGLTPTVNAFRAALGNPNNANAPGPLLSGRREINWDGGGAVNGTAPVTPFLTFQNTRGGTFTTPGTGLTQAPVTGGTQSLDGINAQYADLFAPFSPNRLFAPVGSNITNGFFSIPGTNATQQAGVRGFGVIFSDVDLADTTTIQYFDTGGKSLGVFDVPAIAGNKTFSFFGLIVDPGVPPIGFFQIITGNAALGPDETATTDLVVMDDFIYGEPLRIPLPKTILLVGLGLLATAAVPWLSRASR